MKKNTLMMLALAVMTAGVTLNAANATATAKEAVQTKLSADEMSFVAKLNDQNRHSFNDKLSTEQRKAVMIAAKNGACPNDAVQKMVAATEIKEAAVIANAETAPSADAAAK